VQIPVWRNADMIRISPDDVRRGALFFFVPRPLCNQARGALRSTQQLFFFPSGMFVRRSDRFLARADIIMKFRVINLLTERSKLLFARTTVPINGTQRPGPSTIHRGLLVGWEWGAVFAVSIVAIGFLSVNVERTVRGVRFAVSSTSRDPGPLRTIASEPKSVPRKNQTPGVSGTLVGPETSHQSMAEST